MAEAFVQFVNMAVIDTPGIQHIFYNVTFDGDDVPLEISTGPQNQIEVIKQPTWNLTRIKAEVTRLCIERAASLGLTVASSGVKDADYGIARPILADAFMRTGVTQKVSHSSTNTEQIGILSSLAIVGSVTSVVDATGSYNRYLSPATTGSPGGWKNNAFIGSQPRHQGHFYFRFKTDTDLTNSRIWIETATQYIGNVDVPVTPQVMAFRYSSVAGDVNWQLVTVDPATNATIVDSGVPVVASTPYEMEIDCSVDNEASFYINGLFVGTLAGIPDSTCCCSMTINPTTNSARAILLPAMKGQYK